MKRLLHLLTAIALLPVLLLLQMLRGKGSDDPVLELDTQSPAEDLIAALTSGRLSEFWAHMAPLLAPTGPGVGVATAPKVGAALGALCDQLSWEVGPDPSGGTFFAISPSFDRSLISVAEQIVASAPPIPSVNVVCGKPRRMALEGKVRTARGEVSLKELCEGLSFVVRKSDDGETLLLFRSEVLSGSKGLQFLIDLMTSACSELDLLRAFTHLSLTSDDFTEGETGYRFQDLEQVARRLAS